MTMTVLQHDRVKPREFLSKVKPFITFSPLTFDGFMTWLKSVAVTLLQWQMQSCSAHFYEDIFEDDIQFEIPY